MNEIRTIFNDISKASGTNSKKTILMQGLKSVNNIEQVLRLVFNDDKYGVSKKSLEKVLRYNAVKHGRYTDIGELSETIHQYDTGRLLTFDILTEFIDRVKSTSGDATLSYIKEFIKIYNGEQVKLLFRILLKNLRLGISIKMINKTFEELGIKPIEKFGVQLAGKFASVKDYNKGFPCGVGIKYDGERCIAEKKGSVVTMTSRAGIIIDYIPELIIMFKKIPYDFKIDGEINCDNFALLSKRIGRKLENIEPIKDLHFVIFDMLSFNNEDMISCRQKDRIAKYREVFSSYFNHQFIPEEMMIANNQEQLESFYATAISRNEEGIIIKLLENIYVTDSRDSWFKVKPIYENTFEVISGLYGTGKNKDNISKVLVVDRSGKVKTTVSNFKSEEIDVLTTKHNNNTLVGMFIDVAYNEITRKSNTEEYSLRNPRALKLRFDKDEADDVTIEEQFINCKF